MYLLAGGEVRLENPGTASTLIRQNGEGAMEGTTTAQKASLGNCHLHPAFLCNRSAISHRKLCISKCAFLSNLMLHGSFESHSSIHFFGIYWIHTTLLCSWFFEHISNLGSCPIGGSDEPWLLSIAPEQPAQRPRTFS